MSVGYDLPELWTYLFVMGFLFLPIVLIIIDVVFLIEKKEHPIFETFAFFAGTVEMLIAYYLWDLPNFSEPLNVLGTENAHEPVNLEYIFGILLFAIWGFFSYLILKFERKEKISPITGDLIRKKMPPLVEVLCIAGMYVGILLSAVFLLQLCCGATPIPYIGEGNYQISPDRLDGIIILCLSVVPVMYLIHCIHLMVMLVKEKAEEQGDCHYDNKFLERINTWLLKGANLFWMGLVVLLPVLGLLVMILVLFGQQPDSVLLAFTKTSDWILSGEVSPPPVVYDTHYLCTVSLRGHKKLVRPIRFGIRRGEKIVVNRQLCVANAFEQLLEEKTPGFHRALRNFYDRYGYPISRHIRTAFAADVVYIIMKPLEWLFVIILYLFDEKPEDRICSQYLPRENNVA